MDLKHTKTLIVAGKVQLKVGATIADHLGNALVTESGGVDVSAIDTDTALAANSDAVVPSQKAAKAYIDALSSSYASLGILKTLSVNITKANILAMNATPVEVVASGGAGTALEFVSAVLIYDYDTATYGGGGDVTIGYAAGAAVSTTIVAANSFGAAGDKVFSLSKLNAAGGYTMPVNTGLVITNATGAFTDPGTAAGVGRLKIFYRIHTTGL